ncbi:class II aldolase/adducin family protein [Lactobacillus sp. CC-MHH1034]|uniref:class II aldolase/adducin family protein n=1 Tax=Agrilactobacillus fermenti TaxID=2586909 RepID=UPI001E584EDB|nr:class II aldolase/adducin family protein [Agrilactobacillus fermenti]MCD2255560.1 class II aldolase/adducin family protein [Agrilactobacillus fermenti]
MEMMFYAERKDLAHTVQKTFDRLDTNIAGGNMSIKVLGQDGRTYILITPTFMSETYYAELDPAQILVVDAQTREKVDGVGDITREINMHFEAYNTHPGIRCVYHSHAKESMFWATSGLDMPNVTEATRELGQIRVLPYAPATSKALADIVRDNLEKIGDKAMENVFLLNSHGILITATSLHIAARIMETLEWNARIAYQQAIFIKLGLLDTFKSCGQDADKPLPPQDIFPIPLPEEPLKSQAQPFPEKIQRPEKEMIPDITLGK